MSNEKKFTFAKKSGRAFNGAHRDSGTIVHIIEGDELYDQHFGWETALCGTKPGQRGNGWQYDRKFIPSCQKCIDKQTKLINP